MRKHVLFSSVAIVAMLAAGPIYKPEAFDNTLSGLIPDLFAALDVVSRELVGFIPAVARNSTAERAAVGEAVKYPITPSATTGNIVPAMTVPEPTGQTLGDGSITITKAKMAEFGFVGEEQLGLNNGPGYLTVQGDMIAQAIRALVNEVEADLALAAYQGASRATGTSGTTPFATTLGDSAQLRKILDDNGAPISDRALVISTATGAGLRTLGQLTKANEAGDTMTARQGSLMDLHGFVITESGAARSHTKGTNNGSAATNNAGYAVGATVITLGSAGTGTIVAGDVITFAGDTNKYVVVSGDADVSNGGTITLAKPGLRVAIPASATVITTLNSYTANVGFNRNAIVLATRAPALPREGDMALDRMMITDERSGLTFEVSIYGGYRKVRYEIALAWGYKVVKEAHVALMLG